MVLWEFKIFNQFDPAHSCHLIRYSDSQPRVLWILYKISIVSSVYFQYIHIHERYFFCIQHLYIVYATNYIHRHLKLSYEGEMCWVKGNLCGAAIFIFVFKTYLQCNKIWCVKKCGVTYNVIGCVRKYGVT